MFRTTLKTQQLVNYCTRKFSSVNGDCVKQNDFRKYVEYVPLIGTVGSIIYYIDGKFAFLDKSIVDARIEIIKAGEKSFALDSKVEFFSNQLIRGEIRADIKEAEMSIEMNAIREYITKERDIRRQSEVWWS